MSETLLSIVSASGLIVYLAYLLRMHKAVIACGTSLEGSQWTIRAKGSIWEDCCGNILILPNAKGANRAYIKHSGFTHECSSVETFYLRMMARRALEYKRKRKML